MMHQGRGKKSLLGIRSMVSHFSGLGGRLLLSSSCGRIVGRRTLLLQTSIVSRIPSFGKGRACADFLLGLSSNLGISASCKPPAKGKGRASDISTRSSSSSSKTWSSLA